MVATSPKLGKLTRINADNTTQESLSFTQSMGFTTEVPSIASSTTLKLHTASRSEASFQNEEPTGTQQNTEPTMWPGQNHWGYLYEESPLLNLAVGTTGYMRTRTTTQIDARSPREQEVCQKKGKTKLLVKSQTDAVLSSPGSSPEGV